MAVDYDGETTTAGVTSWVNTLPALSGDVVTASWWFNIDSYVNSARFWWSGQTDGAAGLDCFSCLGGAAIAGYMFFKIQWTTGFHEYGFDLSLDDGGNHDQWFHAMMTYDWGSTTKDPALYFDGVDQGAPDNVFQGGSGGRNSSIDSLTVGNQGTGGALAFPGPVAEVAIWNAELGVVEAAALAAGVCPLQINLVNLARYAPLYSSTGTELISGVAGTNTATTYTAVHPPVQQAIIPITSFPEQAKEEKRIYTLAYQAADTPGMYASAGMDPRIGFTEKDGSNRPGANAGGAMVSCVGGPSINEYVINHEDGTLGEYDTTQTDSGDLSAETAAAYNSDYGLQFVIDDANIIYARKNISTPPTGLRLSFRVHPNDLTMGTNEATLAAMAHSPGGPGPDVVWFMYLQDISDVFNLRFVGGSDVGTGGATDVVVATNEWHRVEAYIERATSSVASDGRVRTWVDGALEQDWTGVDNWDEFSYIDGLSFRADQVDYPGTQGSFYIDDIAWNFTGKPIGSWADGYENFEIGVIYIGDASGDDPYFALFDMNTETWKETDDQIAAVSQSNENVGIVWRPQAKEYVVAFNGDQVNSQHMAYYSRRTGVSTWSAPVALYTGTPSGPCYIQTTMIGADDKVHFVLNYDGDLYMRTLNKDNTLSDWPAAAFVSGATYEAVAAPVRYET